MERGCLWCLCLTLYHAIQRQRSRQDHREGPQGEERQAEGPGKVVLDAARGLHDTLVNGQESIDGLRPDDERDRLDREPEQGREAIG